MLKSELQAVSAALVHRQHKIRMAGEPQLNLSGAKERCTGTSRGQPRRQHTDQHLIGNVVAATVSENDVGQVGQVGSAFSAQGKEFNNLVRHVDIEFEIHQGRHVRALKERDMTLVVEYAGRFVQRKGV
jgi:hypothetical protein